MIRRAASNPSIQGLRYWTAGYIVLSGVLPALIHALIGNIYFVGESNIALRQATIFNQLALVGAIYLIKPLYMLLSLAALVLLWKQISAAMRLALFFFLAGETACAVNILFFFYENTALEYLHSFLMVVCLGFLAFTIIEALDHNLLHFSDPRVRCVLLGFCKKCVKNHPGPCILRRVFQWGLPLMGVVAWMPLFAQPRSISYNIAVFAFLSTLSHPLPIQMYEIRFSPLAGIALLAASWGVLNFHRNNLSEIQFSKALLAGSLGYLGFAFMRLAFFTFYWDDLVWFVFWEELTELILVIGILVAVRLFLPGTASLVRGKLWQTFVGS